MLLRKLPSKNKIINQLCSCEQREAVVELDTLDKSTPQRDRYPCGSIDEVCFRLSLC